MFRLSLLPIAFVLLLCFSLSADDFLLRLDTMGFRDKTQNDELRGETILESIEVVVRVNQPFYCRSTIGAAKISFSGLLEQLNDGKFRTHIRYHRSIESGESIKGPNGLPIPITKSTNINTAAIIEVQKTAELGKEDTIIHTRDGTELKTKTTSILSLTRFDPSGY